MFTISNLFFLTLSLAELISFSEAVVAFRGSGGFVAAIGKMRTEDLKAAVLEEVMGSLGSGNRDTERRLKDIEQVLRPMFLSMPKNEHGNLEHSSVRYVLHRLFEQRHGMYIKGLEPSGESWSSDGANAAEIMEDRVPAFVQSLFEERLKGKGLSLQEISMLAATLEHLIHDEAVERLRVVYGAHNISTNSRVADTMLNEMLDTYMTLFILGRNTSVSTSEQIIFDKSQIADAYPGWHATQKFANQVRSSVVASKLAEPDFAGGQLTFNATSQIVEEIGERYGRWQDAECRDLKGELLKLEDHGTGRVQLKNFYGEAVNGGAWQFTESVEYLRELGALDETIPGKPTVVIPNYVNSRSNCLASSSIYSVCCLNECEALMGHIERQVAAPEASVRSIVELVSKLPSATVSAPRELSKELQARLEEVAAHHSGNVPLHGRLFAQWLHHAYPRECPFPHTSGSTNPMTADAWMQDKGAASITASISEMQRHAEAQQTTETQEVVSLPWIVEEELVAVNKVDATEQSVPAAKPSQFRNFGLVVAGLSACLALAHSLTLSFKTIRKSQAADGLLPQYSSKQHCC